MKKLVIAMLVLAATTARAEPPAKEFDMTCVGPYRPERVSYCHFDLDNTPGSEKVPDKCEIITE
jgi:hypothetical protein